MFEEKSKLQWLSINVMKKHFEIPEYMLQLQANKQVKFTTKMMGMRFNNELCNIFKFIKCK